MNTLTETSPGTETSARRRRSIPVVLGPLEKLAAESPHVLVSHLGNETCSIPRFIFNGPRGGGDPIRLSIFAGIHGDEPEGVLATVRFLSELAANPQLATGYKIFAYPVVNPTGFEDNTRHARSGKDLNREFWRASDEPEVFYLEQELLTHQFHGIITLHSDDTSDGVYGFAHGADLTRELLQPALWAAERHLQRSVRTVIDGFPARQGLIDGGYPGILSAPPEQRPIPFALTFETPQRTPMHLQVEAQVSALHCILAEYRTVISLAQGI
jgi:murein peptide amidase A